MVDPNDSKFMGRLTAAIKKDGMAMAPFRRMKRDMIEQLVGTWYSDHGAVNAVHVNYVEMVVDVLVRSIVNTHPRVSITSNRVDLSVVAYELQLAVNKRFKQMNVLRALRDVVDDAMFSVGQDWKDS